MYRKWKDAQQALLLPDKSCIQVLQEGTHPIGSLNRRPFELSSRVATANLGCGPRCVGTISEAQEVQYNPNGDGHKSVQRLDGARITACCLKATYTVRLPSFVELVCGSLDSDNAAGLSSLQVPRRRSIGGSKCRVQCGGSGSGCQQSLAVANPVLICTFISVTVARRLTCVPERSVRLTWQIWRGPAE
jgi:hypothetical protein